MSTSIAENDKGKQCRIYPTLACLHGILQTIGSIRKGPFMSTRRHTPFTRLSQTLMQRSTSKSRQVFTALPPATLLILSMVSVQIGAAFAKELFPVVGASGTVFLRVGIGAVVLLLLWRPRLHSYTRAQILSVVLFGCVLGAMNFSFYQAIAHLPLGIAVTLEFVGPLGVAIAGSRRLIDVVWVVMAATGVALFAPWTGVNLDYIGIGFALLAAAFWAMYIILGSRLGKQFTGGNGLALAMLFATIALLPAGYSGLPHFVAHPSVLLLGTAVAILASVIPYSLEIEALRRIPPHVFGIFMSMEPAIAASVGFLILRETITPIEIIAIVLVSIASFGTSFASGGE